MGEGEMTEAAAKSQASAILERLAPDPTSPFTVMDAACRLLFFGVEATVDALIDGIESNNRGVAILSLDALEWIVSQRQFGDEPLKALPAAVAALRHDDRLVRASAIDAVGEFGELAVEATPALLKIVHTDEEYLRIIAAAALLEVSQDHEEEIRSVLEAAIESGNPMVAFIARESLGLDTSEEAKSEGESKN